MMWRCNRASRHWRFPGSLRVLLPALVAVLVACGGPEPRQVAGGDPAFGPELMRKYSCHACHTIPGVRGADKLAGPPLNAWAERVYIAGHMPNTPENLVRWIMNPQEIHEHTAMPDMGVTEQDARHIAAYLYTLRP